MHLHSAAVSGSAIVLNYYGASTITVPGAATLVQTTNYPYENTISIAVNPEVPGTQFELHLRIPCWSEQSTVTLNGTKTSAVAGNYHVISKQWAVGDTIVLTLDFRLRGWVFGQDFTPARVAASTSSAEPNDDEFVFLPSSTGPEPGNTWPHVNNI